MGVMRTSLDEVTFFNSISLSRSNERSRKLRPMFINPT
jgi:hypothetical protein